jgi:hypothetical protein
MYLSDIFKFVPNRDKLIILEKYPHLKIELPEYHDYLEYLTYEKPEKINKIKNVPNIDVIPKQATHIIFKEIISPFHPARNHQTFIYKGPYENELVDNLKNVSYCEFHIDIPESYDPTIRHYLLDYDIGSKEISLNNLISKNLSTDSEYYEVMFFRSRIEMCIDCGVFIPYTWDRTYLKIQDGIRVNTWINGLKISIFITIY